MNLGRGLWLTVKFLGRKISNEIRAIPDPRVIFEHTRIFCTQFLARFCKDMYKVKCCVFGYSDFGSLC